jgi:hypothetical protein
VHKAGFKTYVKLPLNNSQKMKNKKSKNYISINNQQRKSLLPSFFSLKLAK